MINKYDMRAVLLALLLLAILLTAQQTTTSASAGQAIQAVANLPNYIDSQVDNIAYYAVKMRGGVTTVAIPIPSIAYGQQGNIQLLVIAVPYVPQEAGSTSDIVSALSNIDWTNPNWGSVVQSLLQYRNVLYPYEAFKVKLIFIMFVTTKDLMTLAGQAAQEVARQGNGHPESIFMDQILMAIAENFGPTFEGNIQNQINNIIKDNIKINLPELNVEETKIDTKTIEINYKYNDEYYLTVKIVNKSASTGCPIKYEITINPEDPLLNYIINNIKADLPENSYINDLNNIIESFGISQNQLMKIFPGYTDYSGLSSSINRTIQSYLDNNFTNVYTDFTNSGYLQSLLLVNIEGRVVKYLQQQLSQYQATVTPPFDSTGPIDVTITYCPQSESDISNINNMIISYFESGFPSVLRKSINQLPDEWSTQIYFYISFAYRSVVNSISDLENDFSNMLSSGLSSLGSDISTTIGNAANSATYGMCTALAQNPTFAQQFCSAIAKTSSSVVQTAVSCLSDAVINYAEQGAQEVITAIPGADLVYTIANGVYGALQSEITIKLTITTKPDSGPFRIYEVSSLAACYGQMRGVEESVTSGPSPTEAILAGFLGFASALEEQFTGTNFLDYVPIIREVDLPSNQYYFMPPSKPGIYDITISVDAKNVIDSFLSSISDSISRSLKNQNLEYKYNLVADIASDVRSALANMNFEQVGGSGQSSGSSQQSSENTQISLTVHIVVLSPYMYGTKEGNFFTYSPSLDLFSPLRAYIYDWFTKVMLQLQGVSQSQSSSTTSQASGATSGISSSTLSFADAVETACESITNKYISSLVEKAFNSILSSLPASSGSSSETLCPETPTLQYLIDKAKDTLINDIKNSFITNMENEIINKITGQIVTPICGGISSELNDLVSNIPGIGVLQDFLLQNSAGGGSSPSISLSSGIQAAELGAKLYITRFFSSAEELSYIPSYFLSAYPIAVQPSATVAACYSVVASPYFAYVVLGDQSTANLVNDILKYIGILQYVDMKSIYLPTDIGLNKYFSALSIYPVIAVRDGNDPNPYYFEIPYSAPAKELFIVGSYGSVVAYDGSSPSSFGDKPIYVVDLLQGQGK